MLVKLAGRAWRLGRSGGDLLPSTSGVGGSEMVSGRGVPGCVREDIILYAENLTSISSKNCLIVHCPLSILGMATKGPK